jgi:hypothetical protein
MVGSRRRSLNKLKNGTFKGVFDLDKDASMNLNIS